MNTAYYGVMFALVALYGFLLNRQLDIQRGMIDELQERWDRLVAYGREDDRLRDLIQGETK